MASVRHILAGKSPSLHTIAASASVLDAVHRMNQQMIGSLVITEGDRVVGILTERDILSRVVGPNLPPARVPVGEVMTRNVICCTPDTEIEEASRILRDHRIRHLPVCDEDGAVVGMISIGDLNAYFASDQEATIHYLHEYLYGRV